jgi:hypothetical protein
MTQGLEILINSGHFHDPGPGHPSKDLQHVLFVEVERDAELLEAHVVGELCGRLRRSAARRARAATGDDQPVEEAAQERVCQELIVPGLGFLVRIPELGAPGQPDPGSWVKPCKDRESLSRTAADTHSLPRDHQALGTGSGLFKPPQPATIKVPLTLMASVQSC